MATFQQTRRLPEGEVLAEHVAAGMTKKQIAARYGVTVEAVRQSCVRYGIELPRERPSHNHYVPWRLRGDHVGHVLARRLRAYSKRQQGIRLSPQESKLLDEFIEYMEGSNPSGLPLSVHYDRLDNEGFWLEARQPGDRDFISPPIQI